MKTVVLRESQAPYTLAIDDETMNQEPVILERDGRPVAVLVPLAEYEAFRAWREMLDEPWPEEPPPTPEGDQEALAAVERIGTMFPPLDAETARYIAESEELALDYKFLLDDED
jgi:PHD/YefM family antitoxin component YafN of YafNO toxin-antitoxin module